MEGCRATGTREIPPVKLTSKWLGEITSRGHNGGNPIVGAKQVTVGFNRPRRRKKLKKYVTLGRFAE
jgi:hypothetical protein